MDNWFWSSSSEQEYFCYGTTYSAFRVKVKPSLGQGLILIPLYNWNMDHINYKTKENQGQNMRRFLKLLEEKSSQSVILKSSSTIPSKIN